MSRGAGWRVARYTTVHAHSFSHYLASDFSFCSSVCILLADCFMLGSVLLPYLYSMSALFTPADAAISLCSFNR